MKMCFGENTQKKKATCYKESPDCEDIRLVKKRKQYSPGNSSCCAPSPGSKLVFSIFLFLQHLILAKMSKRPRSESGKEIEEKSTSSEKFEDLDKWKRIRFDEKDETQEFDALYENILELFSEDFTTQRARVLIDALLKASCCARCILRFLGLKNFDCYSWTEETLLQVLNRLRSAASTEAEPPDHPATEKLSRQNNEKPVCVTCLDLLYHADTMACVGPIFEAIKNQGHQAKDFTIIVTLPISTIVRNHSAAVWVKYNLRPGLLPYEVSLVIDMAKIFRYLLGQALEKISGLKHNVNSHFKIEVEYIHVSTQSNHIFLTKIPEANLKFKNTQHRRGYQQSPRHSRQEIFEALKKVTDDKFMEQSCRFRSMMCPPAEIQGKCEIQTLVVKHDPLYLGGRYIKLSRNISQTPWLIDNVRLKDTSVSECIAETIRRHFVCDGYTFTAAGREDFDVRMLGSGRPFYFEIINPRKPSISPENLSLIEKEINEEFSSLVQVRDLCIVKQEQLQIIKKGEDQKSKTYSALVWISRPVTSDIIQKINAFKETGLVLNQATPVRVLQRRADLVRQREIWSMEAAMLEGNFLTIKMKTEAGTYIKEFIHGDLGKTQPSLPSLLDCTADLLELDVLDVDLEWPPIQKGPSD
ncbi:hypothetical protein G9A89_002414 [Geosiphon pyriformis]|nr:hypothetical protein G9A89_002414 [Geosiphon pyriformis]